MKIAASEAQWDTCSHCPFSLFQIGGFTASDPTPSFSIEIPDGLSFLATELARRRGPGAQRAQPAEQKQYARQNGRNQSYLPPVEAIYWSMRGMAYAGSLVALIAVVGAFLYRRRKLEQRRWFLWVAVAGSFLPFVGDHVRLAADRARPPAVDRAGAAADERTRTRRPSARPGS